MPYAEKRGDGPYPWRVRYKAPDGSWPSEPGFATEQDALNYGHEQEVDIRRGVWIDPRRARITLDEWAQQWMDAQNKPLRTTNTRVTMLRRLLPHFGPMQLRDITWWEAQTWADQQNRSRRTIRDDLSFMSSILNGAVDARYLGGNPLAGRRLNGTPQKEPEKIWPNPEQAFQIAERFEGMLRVLLHTAYWTGMRDGELMGLHKDNCGLWRRDGPHRRRVIRIDPKVGQLIETFDYAERTTKVFLGPPKPPNGAREIDIPDFLADMLDEHIASWPFDYPFCRFDGGWWQRSGLNPRWQPAADGREEWRHWRSGRLLRESWEPILPGLTMHGFRHGHNTLMVEEGIAEPLRCDRMGHQQRGIQGVYSHPSPMMRRGLLDVLERRWEAASGRLRRRTGLRRAK